MQQRTVFFLLLCFSVVHTKSLFDSAIAVLHNNDGVIALGVCTIIIIKRDEGLTRDSERPDYK